MADTTTSTTSKPTPESQINTIMANWSSTNKPFDAGNSGDSFFREVYHSLHSLNELLPLIYSILFSNSSNNFWVYNKSVGANANNFYWSDLTPAPKDKNIPKVGDTVVDLIGNVYSITAVNSDGNSDHGGGTASYGPLLVNIAGNPDLSAYLKSADADTKYTTVDNFNNTINELPNQYLSSTGYYNGNIDNLRTVGFYSLGSSSTGYPDAGGILLVGYIKDYNTYTQMLIGSKGDMFYRISNPGATTWQSFIQVKEGKDGSQGHSIYVATYQEIDNGTDYYWSDLGSSVSADRPPVVGDSVISPDGSIRRIVSVVVGGNTSGGSFSVGPTIANIKGKDGTTPDLTGVVKSATVNGGTAVKPDVSGNIAITIPAGGFADATEFTGDLNDCQNPGWYLAKAEAVKNVPHVGVWWTVLVGRVPKSVSGSNDRVVQIAYSESVFVDNGAQAWNRILGDTGTWSPWLEWVYSNSLGQFIKTVAVNGGTAVSPDSNGNVALTVPDPDLTPYLKSADAANTYQTPTQVQAQVDAKIVPVADEATATSNSTTNTTVLYLVPEAS